jgi:hypothetical protein
MAERTEQLGGLRAKNAAAGRKKQEERSETFAQLAIVFNYILLIILRLKSSYSKLIY